MRLKFLWILCLGFAKTAMAVGSPYDVKNIPADLLVKANAVKRLEEKRFEIINLNETVITYKYAITIVSEGGAYHAQFQEQYDKLRIVKSVQGTLYDANGNQIKRVTNKGVGDVKLDDGMSLLDDERMRVHNFYHNSYPYTVEYEVEMKRNHTFYLDAWYPQDAERLSVQQSNFVVVSPESYNVRFKSFNTSAPQVTTEKGKKSMQWSATNLAAFIRPFAAPVWAELTPVVHLAPSDFALGSYKGNMGTWADLGKFQFELNKGRDKLPDAMVQQAKQIAAGFTTDREKIKALYEFMQKNTRYISIQLGIGGWQPFEASFIAQKGYGDCKGLSNYMYSLLKAVDIKSHYAIIYAGNSKEARYMMEDFPSKQSNHVVLCVPLQKDTLWLECTSQTDPAGYMGSFTGNRKALIVDENGGALVATPRYKLTDNLLSRTVSGTIDAEGHLQATVRTLYTGIQQDNLVGMVTQLSKEKVKKELNQNLSFSTYEINDFKYDFKKDIFPSLEEKLDLTVSNFSTVSGKRIFISPNLLNRSSVKLEDEEKNRKVDYVFDIEWRDVDSIVLQVPDGYELEAMPQPVTLQTKFGLYKSSVQLKNNTLVYYRTMEQYAGRFPPTAYTELAEFYGAVYKADRNRIVLVKK